MKAEIAKRKAASMAPAGLHTAPALRAGVKAAKAAKSVCGLPAASVLGFGFAGLGPPFPLPRSGGGGV